MDIPNPDLRIDEEAVRTAAIAIMEAIPEDALDELNTRLERNDAELEAFLRVHVPHYDHVLTHALTPLATELRRMQQ
jgi:hypothetical protein